MSRVRMIVSSSKITAEDTVGRRLWFSAGSCGSYPVGSSGGSDGLAGTTGCSQVTEPEYASDFVSTLGRATGVNGACNGTREKSGIGLVVRYRKDVNLDGEPILLDGKQYGKGLSMHAHTELEYNLGGKYKDLKGLLGADTRIAADSQATVTVWCDGEKRFSEVITAKELKQLNVNVKDVQTLKIVVASRNFLDLHDHVTIVEARVSQ